MNKIQPLLTVAIPTWNRSLYLNDTLKQIHQELTKSAAGNVEILISDNFSSDNTPEVVDQAKMSGLNLRYIRNLENIGSDANIAQCFNMANGKYVLILGDDDLFYDGALPYLLERLDKGIYGVVCLRSYGFDFDFRHEYPGVSGYDKVFQDPGAFLAKIGPLMTLISSCVVHKSLLPKKIDANEYCGENLVQVHLVIQATFAAQENLFVSRYLIACKRNNSGGYDFSKVFVENLGNILDRYSGFGLTKKAIISIEKRLMIV
jgi:glycosyltransferase involved in cell wall biosynthesis